MDLKDALKALPKFAEDTRETAGAGVEAAYRKAGYPPDVAQRHGEAIRGQLPSGPGLVGMLAAMLLPGRRPLVGALTRMFGGATAAAGTAKVMGQPPSEAATSFLAQQGSAEALFGVGRGIQGQRTGRTLFKDREAQILANKEAYQQAKTARRETIRQQQVPYRQATDLQKSVMTRAEEAQAATHREAVTAQTTAQQQATTAHEAAIATQTAQHATTQSQQIGDLVKSQVPPFQGVPSTPGGLWRMAYGPEWYAVNTRYDEYLTQAIQLGRGQRLTLPAKAAHELGIPAIGVVERGPLQTSLEDLVVVDGGLLAGGMKGQWKAHRSAYNAGARAIDEAGIGDPAERAIYRNAQSFRMFMDRSQALEGQTFHPDRVLKYLGRLKANQEVLGPRHNVELYRALEAAKPPISIPPPPPIPAVSKPTPIPAFPTIPRPIPPPIPQPPALPPPSGIERHQMPILAIPGLITGALAGHATGIPHLTWPGAFIGEEAGRRFGPKIPTYSGVPRTPIGKPEVIGRTLTGETLRQIWDYINAPVPQ